MRAKIFAKEKLVGEVTLDARGRATWPEELNFLEKITYDSGARRFLDPSRARSSSRRFHPCSTTRPTPGPKSRSSWKGAKVVQTFPPICPRE